MHRLKNSIEIAARPERVYELIATPQNLPRIWPSMIDVSNVQQRPDGGMTFDWLYKMAGLHFRGRSESVRMEPNKLLEFKNASGIPSTIRWTFEPRGSGTLLTSEIEYDIPGPVLGKLAEAIVAKLNEREQKTVLENAKTAVELSPEASPNGPARTVPS